MCSHRKRQKYVNLHSFVTAKDGSKKDRKFDGLSSSPGDSRPGHGTCRLYDDASLPRPSDSEDASTLQKKGVEEPGILATAGIWVAVQLLKSSGQQTWTEAVLLCMLVLMAITVEWRYEAVIRRLYTQRDGAHSGLSLGSVALPLVFAARVVQDGLGEGGMAHGSDWIALGIPPRLNLWITMASSAGALGAAVACSILKSRSSDSGGKEETRSSGDSRWARVIGWFAGASVFASLPLVLSAAQVPVPGFVAGKSSIYVTFVLAHACACGLLLDFLLASFTACVSAGEGLLVAEGLTLLAGDVIARTIGKCWPTLPLPPHCRRVLSGTGTEIDVIVQAMIAGVLLIPVLSEGLRRASTHAVPALLSHSPPPAKEKERLANVTRTASFYAALALVVTMVAPTWLKSVVGLQTHPVLWALKHVLENAPVRLMLCGYWLAVMLAPLRTLQRMSTHGLMARILVRKWYHIMAVSMFVPALIVQANFLRLAFGVALAGLLVVEMLRVARIPPFGELINGFMGAFVDARDSDRLIISHFSLLLGCALPLWLSPTASNRPLAAFAGILGVGIGDTAASVVGYKYGRTPVSRGSRKTVEGTCAGIISMLLACLLLSPLLPNPPGSLAQWFGVVVATAVAGSLEAHTTQLDNAFVPLLYFALLSL